MAPSISLTNSSQVSSATKYAKGLMGDFDYAWTVELQEIRKHDVFTILIYIYMI